MDTQAKILAIVSRAAGKPVTAAPDESLFQSGVLDSFTLADLVSALEQEFAVKIPDTDLTPRKFDSIERIEAYLASRS
jgi:acyl carrier protein